MHELGLVEDLVSLVESRTTGRTVVSVRLRVGRAAGVMADAMAFCWDVVTVGTGLAGSRLEIEETDDDQLALASVELVREESHV
jgi:hydrogenase nickel incorporation protein HypA/HybF